MKNKIIFLFILFSYTVSATPYLEFQYNHTQPGETILATISTSGEFTKQIEKSQIKFFKGRKEIVLESDISFYNKTHYLSIYTTSEENLTLRIENILYKEYDTLQSFTISRNISIQKNTIIDKETNETSTQILKIKPGFITSFNPTLKLTNVGTSQLTVIYNKEDILIEPFSSKELEFTPEESFSLTKISTYKDFLIPTIYLKLENNNTTNFTNTTQEIKPSLKYLSEDISLEISTGEKYKKIIELLNFGDENITNLKIYSTLDFLTIEKLQDMQGKETQNMTLSLEPESPGNFYETVYISYTQNETTNILEIPLTVLVLPKGVTKENFTQITEKCEDIGQVCESESICNGTSTFTDNYTKYCCSASCILKDKNTNSSSNNWIIGILILVVLGFIGYYFYKKQKQLKPQTPKDFLKATTEKFEKNIIGNQITKTKGNVNRS